MRSSKYNNEGYANDIILLRDSAEPSLADYNFEEQQGQRGQRPWQITVLGMREMFHIKLGLLELVDFGENLLEHAVAGGTEIFSTGDVGDLFQCCLVDHNRLWLILDASKHVVHRVKGRAVGADTDGVDFYAELAGYLGGCERGHDTGVV